MSKLKLVTMDLDTTICDTSGRPTKIDRNLTNGPEFWERYSLDCVTDTPGPALPLAQHLTDAYLPWVVVSGRSEIARSETRTWLWEHGARPWGIYLCDDRHNYMSHGEWKATRLLEIQEELDAEIIFHVDDYLDVAVQTEKIGIRTLLVHSIDSPVISQLG